MEDVWRDEATVPEGDVKEDRTVGVLLRFILGWKKDYVCRI